MGTTMMASKSLILTLAVVVALAAARPEVKDLIKDLDELGHDVARIAKEVSFEEATCKDKHGKCVAKGAIKAWEAKHDCDEALDCNEGLKKVRFMCCVKKRPGHLPKASGTDWQQRENGIAAARQRREEAQEERKRKTEAMRKRMAKHLKPDPGYYNRVVKPAMER